MPDVELKGEWTSTFMKEMQKISSMLGIDIDNLARKFYLRKGKKKITDATVSYFAAFLSRSLIKD